MSIWGMKEVLPDTLRILASSVTVSHEGKIRLFLLSEPLSVSAFLVHGKLGLPVQEPQDDGPDIWSVAFPISD